MKRRGHVLGFSLLEVVIVVAIIAILAAIGIPRMSRGSKGAGDSALRANLAVLRNAIDLYAAEHQGTYPTLADIDDQLTQYTNAAGDAQAAKDTTHYFGPYLRSIPPLPVGANKGNTGFTDAYDATVANGNGWVYTVATGEVVANTDPAALTGNRIERDDEDVLYSDY